MSMHEYLRLRSELGKARAVAVDGPDEDRLLGEMDDLWWEMSDVETAQIRALLQPAPLTFFHQSSLSGKTAFNSLFIRSPSPEMKAAFTALNASVLSPQVSGARKLGDLLQPSNEATS